MRMVPILAAKPGKWRPNTRAVEGRVAADDPAWLVPAASFSITTDPVTRVHGNAPGMLIRFVAKASALNGEVRFGVPHLRGSDRLKAELRTLLAANRVSTAPSIKSGR